MLNDAARKKLAERRELGPEVTVTTDQGSRQFADNDRILFLRNERELGVKNGTLGTIEKAAPDRLAVRLDDGRNIAFDLGRYAHIDHGYAATIHKAQGMTVDKAHVLATPGLDAHGAYVALSRHRSGTSLHYGRDDFADQAALARTLARERLKDMALDYGSASAGARPARAPNASPRTDQAQDARGNAEDRARQLRAMVAARVGAAGSAAETVRAKVARTAQAIAGRATARVGRDTANIGQAAEHGKVTVRGRDRGRDRDQGAGL
jgi:hypothetical protein